MNKPDAEVHSPIRDVSRFTKSFVQGDFVCRQGDVGHTMFIIVEGQVEVLRSSGGTSAHLATLGKGDSFGEISLVTGELRSADIRVVTPTLQVVEIDKARFVYLVGQQPAFALTIMSRLCALIRQTMSPDTPAANPTEST